MTPDDGRPTFEEARSLVRAAARHSQVEWVVLEKALGRIVGAEVIAQRDSPVGDMAAMDGFTVPPMLMNRSEPLALGTPIFAGSPVSPEEDGKAHPISTGAMVPSGTAAVVPHERTEMFGDDGAQTVRVVRWIASGGNIRRKGEDARAGERLLSGGELVSAETIGALASFGVARISVVRTPSLAIVTTGDELVPLGDRAHAHQQINSNGPMIAAMAARAGVPVHGRNHATDTPASLTDALAEAAAGPADLVITTAGVSRGSKNFVRAAVEDLGATVLFHGVRMRPGKPVLFACYPDGTLHFGLPGNPVAAAVAMRFFVFGAIRASLGLPVEEGCPVDTAIEAHADSTRVLKAYQGSAWGEALEVDLASDQRSHTLRPLLTANLWVVVPPGGSGGARAFPMAAGLSRRS